MNLIKKGFLVSFILIMVFLMPSLSFAQTIVGSGSGTGADIVSSGSGTGTGIVSSGSGTTTTTAISTKIKNPISVNTINEFIKIILQSVIKIGIPVIALAIIYSGFLFVSAQGNSEKLKTAQKALTYSVIGAAILLGSWAIAQLISETVLKVTS